MANTLYDNARQLFLTKQIDWVGDTIKCALVDSTYTPNFSSHVSLADVSATSFVAPTANTQVGSTLNSRTAVAGAANAASLTFSSVVSADQGKALLLYKDDGSGVLANFALIAYIDAATGLPITPNGGDIIVVWDTGVNKIFRL